MLVDTNFSTLADHKDPIFYERAKDRLSRIQFDLLKIANEPPESEDSSNISLEREDALYAAQDRLFDELKERPVSSMKDTVSMLEIWARVKIATYGKDDLSPEDELIMHVIDGLKLKD